MTLALGGMTVGDTVRKMTVWEIDGWRLFEKEFGPLDMALRFEGAVARAVLPFLKKGTPIESLMPWPKKPEEPASFAAVFGLLQSTARKRPDKDK